MVACARGAMVGVASSSISKNRSGVVTAAAADADAGVFCFTGVACAGGGG